MVSDSAFWIYHVARWTLARARFGVRPRVWPHHDRHFVRAPPPALPSPPRRSPPACRANGVGSRPRGRVQTAPASAKVSTARREAPVPRPPPATSSPPGCRGSGGRGDVSGRRRRRGRDSVRRRQGKGGCRGGRRPRLSRVRGVPASAAGRGRGCIHGGRGRSRGGRSRSRGRTHGGRSCGRMAEIVAEVASTADEVVAEAASTADEGGRLSDGDRHVAAEMAGKLRAGHCPHQQRQDHSYPVFSSAAALQRPS